MPKSLTWLRSEQKESFGWNEIMQLYDLSNGKTNIRRMQLTVKKCMFYSRAMFSFAMAPNMLFVAGREALHTPTMLNPL